MNYRLVQIIRHMISKTTSGRTGVTIYFRYTEDCLNWKYDNFKFMLPDVLSEKLEGRKIISIAFFQTGDVTFIEMRIANLVVSIALDDKLNIINHLMY